MRGQAAHADYALSVVGLIFTEKQVLKMVKVYAGSVKKKKKK